MASLPKFSSSRWILATFFTFAAGVNVCSAQYGELPYAVPPIVNASEAYAVPQSDVYSPSGTYPYGDYQSVSIDPVDELYNSNAKLPLGGLFAKGFTRTLTVMGGVNYANSFETSDFNFAPDIGGSFFNSLFSDPDSGYAVSFAFGRRHNHNLRSEIEIAVRGNDLATGGFVAGEEFGTVEQIDELSFSNDDDQITTYSVMKNFIHDFSNRSRFTPYVGIGLGYSYLDVEAIADGVDDGVSALSYQAIGGVATKLNKATDLVVEYRFLATTEAELDNGFDIDYEAHNIFLGVKFEY